MEKKLPLTERIKARVEGWWESQSKNHQLAWLAVLVIGGVVCLAAGLQLLS